MPLSRARKAAADPGQAAAWLAARLFPERYPTRQAQLARAAGLTCPLFALSFDCDTDQDTAVLERLHVKLRESSLSPAYAAAGEVMVAAPSIYRDLASDGAELLNHGYRRHAAVDGRSGNVVSTFFYSAAEPDVWTEDVRRGHDAVANIVGCPPLGFRTPHFGSFEEPDDLARLWRLLAELGYAYSSSTRPLFGWRFGPAFRRHGIVEFPVSGCLNRPAQILDSWGLVRSAGAGSGRLVAALDDYRLLMEQGTPVLLNVYLDPADVVDDEMVLTALARLAPFGTDGLAGALRAVGHV